jgi:hypothetical protein
MRTWLAGILFFSPFFFPMSAQAERCWMVGCVGDIGYLYIPGSQITVTAGMTGVSVNAVHYKLDSSDRLLTDYGLPQIGSSVTLNTLSILFPFAETSAPEVQQEIKKPAYLYEKDTQTARLYRYSFDENRGSPMARGARLKVLGYWGDALSGSSKLFALVMVESDGPAQQ